MKTNRLPLLACSLLLVAGCHRSEPTVAVASSSAPAANPAAAAASGPASHDLYSPPQLAQAFDRIVDQQRAIIALSIGTQVKRIQGNASAAETQKLVDQVVDLLWSGINRQRVTTALAGIYQAQFTAAQLTEIAAFYATPSGQAVLAKTPAIQAQFSQVMMSQLQTTNPKAVELMNAFAVAHSPPAPGK